MKWWFSTNWSSPLSFRRIKTFTRITPSPSSPYPFLNPWRLRTRFRVLGYTDLYPVGHRGSGGWVPRLGGRQRLVDEPRLPGPFTRTRNITGRGVSVGRRPRGWRGHLPPPRPLWSTPLSVGMFTVSTLPVPEVLDTNK